MLVAKVGPDRRRLPFDWSESPMKKLAVFLLLVCPLFGQAPANDLCAGSILLPGQGTFAGTNVSATASTFGVGTCGLPGVDVWYRYVASGTGNRLVVSTCPPGSSTFSSGVDIFTGASCFTLTTANCNTTHCDNGSGITGGRAITTTTAGVTYWIRVKTVGAGGTGTFMLDVSEVAGGQTNGTCATAQTVVDGINAGKSNFGEPAALQAGFTPCTAATRDVFFTYNATGTGGTIVKTCFPNPASVPATNLRDSVIAVYANCAGGAPLACSSSGGCAGVPGQGGNLTNVSFNSVAGTTYIIQVAGVSNSEGNFDLEIIPPPQNDDCTGALPVTLGPNGPFSNQNASDSVGYAGSCATGFKDLFYAFTPNCGALVTISTGCSGFDTVLSVWNTCGGAELACDDNSGACFPNSQLTVSMSVGNTYIIRVASWSSGSSGTFNVDISSGFGLNWNGIGPGAVQFSLCNGPPSGHYYMFATPTLATPTGAGWFYGVNMTLLEIMNQINFGFPFNAPLDAFGNFVSPVLGGLPSGLPFDSIAFALPPASSTPSANSGAKNATIP
jgi:hypothetical protein